MLTVTPTPALTGTQQSATLTWNFSSGGEAFDYLAVGETLILEYTIQATDDDGTALNDTETVTITITGTNDAPFITDGPDTAALTESDIALSTAGTLTVSDLDTSDTVAVSHSLAVTGTSNRGDAAAPSDATLEGMLTLTPTAILDNATNSASLGWSFDSSGEAFDYLALGETLILTYTVTATDSQTATTTETVTITITGTNDDPTIAIGAGSAAETVTETNTTLSTNGSLDASDVDTSDTVTVSVTNVVESGTTSGITNGTLLAMMNANAGNVISGAANDGTVNWNFNSNGEAFDYLAVSESLTLTYTLEIADVHGATDTQDVVITINGTNDDPVARDDNVTITVTSPNGFVVHPVVASDLDASDTLGYAITAGNDDHIFTIDPATGEIRVLDTTQLNDLINDPAQLTVTVNDDHGATDVATIGINVVNRELFISEYVEGTGDNQALEFYNPTGADLDLSNYSVEIHEAGGGVTVIPLSSIQPTLEAGKTLVIINGASTNPELIDLAGEDNAGFATFSFDGNDAIVLKNGPTIIDQIGKSGSNPGTEWASEPANPGDDPTHSTGDQTLVRRPGILIGNPGGFDSGAGNIDPLVDQFIARPVDTFSGLGSHQASIPSPDPAPIPKVTQPTPVPAPAVPPTPDPEPIPQDLGPNFNGITNAFRSLADRPVFAGFRVDPIGETTGSNSASSIGTGRSNVGSVLPGLPPLSTLTPYFAGTGKVGSQMIVMISDGAGGFSFSQTVLVDSAGAWSAAFSGLELEDRPYMITIQEVPAVIDVFETKELPSLIGVFSGGILTDPNRQNLSFGDIFGRIIDTESVDEAIEQLDAN